MALTIGRAGRGSTSGTALALPDPSNWVTANGVVTLSGSFQISPVTDALRLRDQLLGYQDNQDEGVVPVVVDSEPRLTGYYRVLGVRITTDVTAMAAGFLAYDVTLLPVHGFTQPLAESILTGTLRTNVVGGILSDADGFHAYPNAALEYSPSTTGTLFARGSSDGTLNVLHLLGALSFTTRFGLAPTNFYVGASTIEQGSPLQPVVGRLTAQPDVTNWRLTNGVIRITPSGTSDIAVSFWTGSVWTTAKVYTISQGGVNKPTWTTITVLRNSVEETIIRLASTLSGGLFGSTVLDIGLRRGDRLAQCYLQSTQSAGWRLARGTGEAGTAITYSAVAAGGIRATADDVDTIRYVMVSYQQAVTSTLGTGQLQLTVSGTTMDFGLGAESTGGTGVASAQNYLAAQSELQRLVAR